MATLYNDIGQPLTVQLFRGYSGGLLMPATQTEQATIYQGVQFGVESTPGTAVPAIVKLSATDIDMAPKHRLKMRRRQGNKFNTSVTRGKGHSEGRITGDASFIELAYFLASLMKSPTITNITTAKTWKWVFLPDIGCADVYETYTVEKGCGTGGSRMTNGTVGEFGIRANENEVSTSGSFFGTTMTDNFTMTTPIQIVPDIPVDPDSIDILVGSSIGGLTQLHRCTEWEWNIADRRKMLFTLDRSKSSYSALIENAMQITSKLTVEKDTEGIAMLSDLAAKSTKFLQVRMTGPPIPDDLTKNYYCYVTMPFKYTNVDIGDKDGMYGGTFDLEPIIDLNLGGAGVPGGIMVEMQLPISSLTDTSRMAAVYNL